MSNVIRIGTRGSQLALWQAEYLRKQLAAHSIESELVIIKTQGDRIQHLSFDKMEGKGFFTKELQEALLERRIDLVVHSLKDLPTEEPEGLAVAAIPERADPADLLLTRPDAAEVDPADPLGLPPGTVVGTSSLRRAAQVLVRSPGAEIRALRGNVPTRIRKLREGQYDVILVAAAGVARLGLDLDDLIVSPLPSEAMLPAPGQGALAIETRAGDEATRILERLHDPAVARCVEAERTLLALLGGGCHLPLGCHATEDLHGIRLQAVLGEIDDDATRATVARVAGLAAEPELAARICYEALGAALPGVVSR